MNPALQLITTSWDDGHPLDFKIAELLDKYRLKGTFYIPRANGEHEVMDENKIEVLSRNFEIGGHTLNHIRLGRSQRKNFEIEIKGSYNWLKNLLSYEPVSFCFPGGVYDSYVVDYARASGYKIFRTVELLSVDNNFKNHLLPTTMQMYEHNKFTYFKHLLKRAQGKRLIEWLRSHSETDLLKLADYYIHLIEKKGSGCFHLWGHSWEIEAYSLWDKLELLFKHLSQQENFTFVQNRELL